ncbi:MAG: TolC family protein [Deltaproteobacteria bacterium]|nr:TolC family protein [Deltaproteobacteria bacterium]MBW2071860.1 TolC family protein [Deltaproteobacteria bacterium]
MLRNKSKMAGILKIVALVIAATITTTSKADAELPKVTIGIVRDGPALRYQEKIKLFKDEILHLTTGEYNVVFPSDKIIDGNWEAAGIRQAIDQLLEDPEVDMVLTLGVFASNDVCHRQSLPKPVIAPFIVDAQLQGLPNKDGASGVKNLSYVDSFTSFATDIATFLDVVTFHRLAVLVPRVALDTIPGLRQKIIATASEYNVDAEVIGVAYSAAEALSSLPDNVDSVYVDPLPRLSPSEFDKLVSGLIQRRLPSFSVWGREEVEQGLFTCVRPESDLLRLARRVALNVMRTLLGEKPETFKVAFAAEQKITINMATARAIGVYPSWSVLTEAELINEEVQGMGRQLTLQTAVQEALVANLDLLVQQKVVAAGKQAVKQRQSALLPQVDLESAGVIIDEDRAEASMGTESERRWTGSVRGTQLIYSEDAWSSFTAEKHLQVSREQQRETVKLDVIRDAAVAYLDVLRAKTLERVEKANLRLTRANLERAKARVAIGLANRSEEYRWESQIAVNRSAVLDAIARTRQAENRLNRILHRPLEEQLTLAEENLKDPLLLVSDPRLFPYVENPRYYRIYRDFIVEQGLAIAPELKRLDAAIQAQQRILTAARRAFWLPTFSLQGDVTETFDKGGAGSSAPKGFDNFDIPRANDTDWSVGLFATFPFFTGGGKVATLRRYSEELSGLQTQRQAVAERVEERIRRALFRAGASYPNIKLSRDAAVAARKNLELVTDQYVRGLVSIIDLLDAQNSSLAADRRAENAVYDFLVDYTNVQRAAGRFDFFLSAPERDKWFHELELYFEKTGIVLRKS